MPDEGGQTRNMPRVKVTSAAVLAGVDCSVQFLGRGNLADDLARLGAAVDVIFCERKVKVGPKALAILKVQY